MQRQKWLKTLVTMTEQEVIRESAKREMLELRDKIHRVLQTEFRTIFVQVMVSDSAKWCKAHTVLGGTLAKLWSSAHMVKPPQFTQFGSYSLAWKLNRYDSTENSLKRALSHASGLDEEDLDRIRVEVL